MCRVTRGGPSAASSAVYWGRRLSQSAGWDGPLTVGSGRVSRQQAAGCDGASTSEGQDVTPPPHHVTGDTQHAAHSQLTQYGPHRPGAGLIGTAPGRKRRRARLTTAAGACGCTCSENNVLLAERVAFMVVRLVILLSV